MFPPTKKKKKDILSLPLEKFTKSQNQGVCNNFYI